MFDPRDLTTDPRTRKPAVRPRRDHAKEREARQRGGHRREYDPRSERQNFQERIDRAMAEIGIYRSIATRDLAEAHFEGHPFAARRAVERMVRSGHVREHTSRGPQGGAFTRCSRSPNVAWKERNAWRANKDSIRSRRPGAAW